MDPLLMARAQFALTVIFHFIFPSITIGLALLVAIALTLRWRRKDEAWERMAAFWTRVFALTFTVGVATGIVMEFQFGTNWSRYSAFVGDIFGAPLAAEGVFAFFLESTFLGLLLFGGARIGDGLRAFSGWMVALGSTLSGFWIIVANSWMQTPAGYEVQGSKAVLTDFLGAVFNPSTLPRFFHTIASSWTAAAFIVTGVAAWWVLRGRHADVAARSIRLGLVVALVGAASMFATGDMHARQVANTQPAKFAGMNALYETTAGAPLVVWSLPPSQDPATTMIGPELLVGRMLSFLAFGSFDAQVTGLSRFPTSDWPPITATFLAYHNMVILGSLMLLLMLAGAWLLWRGRLERSRTWLRFAVLAIPLPMIAIQLGWATAEIGRQPWIVYDVMRTDAGTSTVVSGTDLAISLVLFAAVYALLGVLWLGTLVREIRRGPAPPPAPDRAASPALGEPAHKAARIVQPHVDTTGTRGH